MTCSCLFMIFRVIWFFEIVWITRVSSVERCVGYPLISIIIRWIFFFINFIVFVFFLRINVSLLSFLLSSNIHIRIVELSWRVFNFTSIFPKLVNVVYDLFFEIHIVRYLFPQPLFLLFKTTIEDIQPIPKFYFDLWPLAFNGIIQFWIFEPNLLLPLFLLIMRSFTSLLVLLFLIPQNDCICFHHRKQNFLIFINKIWI